MKSFLSGILCAILGCMISFAQTKNDTLIAWQQYQKGDSLVKARKYDKAISHFKEAASLYQKAKQWERVAHCYNTISDRQWRSVKLEASFQNAKKALRICNQYLTKDHLEKAYTYDNIGNYYSRKPMKDSVLHYLEKSLQIKKKLFPEHHLSIAKSYSYIAFFLRENRTT